MRGGALDIEVWWYGRVRETRPLYIDSAGTSACQTLGQSLFSRRIKTIQLSSAKANVIYPSVRPWVMNSVPRHRSSQ